MRRWTPALVVLAVLALMVVGAVLLFRAAFGTTNEDKARDEAQALYDRVSARDAIVERCRAATERDVDSPTHDTFACRVDYSGCTSDEILVIPRAATPGRVDGPTRERDGPAYFHKVAPGGRHCR
jgi:hypothetical protein